MDTRQTYTIEEAARILGIGRNAAYQAASRGGAEFPVIRVGRRLLVPKAALERLLAQPVAQEPRSAT